MANLIDTILDRLAERISRDLIGGNKRADTLLELRRYRLGRVPEQLKRSRYGHNDNVALNFCGLVIDRGVSQTIGKGVKLRFEGDDTESESNQAKYVRAVLDANKQEVLFHRSLLFSGEDGTGFWMLIPDGVTDQEGALYPRILALDPLFMTINTRFGDVDIIESYAHEFKEFDPITKKEIAFKKVVRRDFEAVDEKWIIEDYQKAGERWTLVQSPTWEYPFSPIIHWQNLPSTDTVYGTPDITDDLRLLQDHINFDASNVNKILRLWAHPQLVIKGTYNQNMNIGPDEAIIVPPEGGVELLSPVGDLPGANNYLRMLRQAFFDISRTVDVDSLSDKLGALTNFALRVLYQDNMDKINTKRELFGDALEELARRLQEMGNLQPVEVEVIWPDWMPKNDAEVIVTQQQEHDLGVVSLQTIAEERGRDWEQEQERIKTEKEATDNVGTFLLRMANRGQETNVMPQNVQNLTAAGEERGNNQ
jgi:hypothetical protein